jgi:hypothetical protein
MMRILISIWFYLIFHVAVIAQVQFPLFDKVWYAAPSGICYTDQLINGEYVVIGGFRTQFDLGQIYMCRLDSLGEIIWEEEFGFPFAADYVSKVIKTNWDTYLLIGYSEGDTLPGFREYAVWNIDSAGNVLFERYYSSGYENFPSDVIETSDSCFTITGVMDAPSLNNWALTLLKIDRFGNQIWRNRIDSLSDYVPYSVAQLCDGRYVVVGQTRISRVTFIASYQSNGQLASMSYPYGNSPNSGGSPIKVFGINDTSFSVFYSVNYISGNGSQIRTIRKDYSSNVVCFETKEHAENISEFFQDRKDAQVLCTSLMYNDLFIMNSDSTFTEVAHQSYEDSVLCKSIIYATTTRDGGYSGVGNSDCGMYTRMYFVKFGPDGRYVPEDFGSSVTTYPNPSYGGTIMLAFDMIADEEVEIKFFSLDGKIVYSNAIQVPANTHTELPIDLAAESINSGTYIVEARTDETVYRNKIVVLTNR